MLFRLLLVLILSGVVWAADRSRLKSAGRSEKLAYGALALAAAYFGLDYVCGGKWPNVDDVLDVTLTPVARTIAALLQFPS